MHMSHERMMRVALSFQLFGLTISRESIALFDRASITISYGNIGDIADFDCKSATYSGDLRIILSRSRMQQLHGIAAICAYLEPDPLFFP